MMIWCLGDGFINAFRFFFQSLTKAKSLKPKPSQIKLITVLATGSLTHHQFEASLTVLECMESTVADKVISTACRFGIPSSSEA